ncbi:enoyl-CoA hydratase/isomerase family protein [Sphingosinicella terrae]|uniref:enoyl-CoA hydratase/isomerase family protein n=1 Tax=Sphingosinicella terrae TaxID=2172047 RepID=UPI000E0E07E7|nr:enoyl-CoA hydratase/isomerase family protein [Sphingosinicella terrae]
MSIDVVVEREGPVGRLRLNRPKTIHALTTGMCIAMTEALLAWRDDPAVRLVVLDHAEGRGFCAGGDVVMLRDSGAGDGTEARAFFHAEYRLNHLLFTYGKPTVAFMDGITMGGGVGISQPCRFRVATENTRYAMPETTIGLFPDVGGGWYLSRLPGRTGHFLALTGARLDGAECLALGIATHFIPADALDDVKARLVERPEAVETILAEASASPPEARIERNRAEIDRLFAGSTLEVILAALETDGSAWAAKELATLRGKSPLSCKVSLRLLEEGAAMPSFADEMRQEFAVASRIVREHDFREGVRALLVDKDNAPRWDPATPEAVTRERVEAIFAPLPKEEEWTPL